MKNFMDFLETNKKRLLKCSVISIVIMLLFGWIFNIIDIEYVITLIVANIIATIIHYQREKKRS